MGAAADDRYAGAFWKAHLPMTSSEYRYLDDLRLFLFLLLVPQPRMRAKTSFRMTFRGNANSPCSANGRKRSKVDLSRVGACIARKKLRIELPAPLRYRQTAPLMSRKRNWIGASFRIPLIFELQRTGLVEGFSACQLVD